MVATGTQAAQLQLIPRRQGNPPAPVMKPRHSSVCALGRNTQHGRSLRCSEPNLTHTHIHIHLSWPGPTYVCYKDSIFFGLQHRVQQRVKFAPVSASGSAFSDGIFFEPATSDSRYNRQGRKADDRTSRKPLTAQCGHAARTGDK